MTPDIARYAHHLDGLDMSDDQKAAFLSALWVYGERVMDLIWGSDPTQLAVGLAPMAHSHAPKDGVELSHTLEQDFKISAGGFPARKDTP